MNRVTQRDLDIAVARLNKLTKSPETSHTRLESGCVSNIGHYHISGAYGGVQLHRMANTGGGVDVISHGGYITKRELFSQIQAMLNILQEHGVYSVLAKLSR